MPRSRRISSASNDVGPFAPSTMSRARTSGALSAVIWSSRAARTRTSQSSSRSSSFEMRLPESFPRGSRARACTPVAQARRAPPPRASRPRCRRCRRPSRRARGARGPRPSPRCRSPERRSAAPRATIPAGRTPAPRTMTTPAPVASLPEDGAADRDRLPGHDLRHRVAALHRVRVHHPGHRLLVRGHVRRGDVLLGPDDREQLGGEAAREPLDLAGRERARVAAHPPSHLRREGAGGRTSTSSTLRAPHTHRG